MKLFKELIQIINMKHVKLDDVIRKPPSASNLLFPSGIVAKEIADKIIDGHYDDNKEYLVQLYKNSEHHIGLRGVFIYTCRNIVKYYDGYDNTPLWFRRALEEAGVDGAY